MLLIAIAATEDRVKIWSVIPFVPAIHSYVTALFSKLKKGRITMNDSALARPRDPWLPNEMNSGTGLQLWWLFLGWVALITTPTTAFVYAFSFTRNLEISFGRNINCTKNAIYFHLYYSKHFSRIVLNYTFCETNRIQNDNFIQIECSDEPDLAQLFSIYIYIIYRL